MTKVTLVREARITKDTSSAGKNGIAAMARPPRASQQRLATLRNSERRALSAQRAVIRTSAGQERRRAEARSCSRAS